MRYLPDPTLNLGCPVWSPDGSRLAYEGWDDSNPARNGIYSLSAADGSDLQRLTASPDGGHDIPGDYAADGRLYFGRDGAGLMVLRTDELNPQPVTSEGYGSPSLSPMVGPFSPPSAACSTLSPLDRELGDSDHDPWLRLPGCLGRELVPGRQLDCAFPGHPLGRMEHRTDAAGRERPCGTHDRPSRRAIR